MRARARPCPAAALLSLLAPLAARAPAADAAWRGAFVVTLVNNTDWRGTRPELHLHRAWLLGCDLARLGCGGGALPAGASVDYVVAHRGVGEGYLAVLRGVGWQTRALPDVDMASFYHPHAANARTFKEYNKRYRAPERVAAAEQAAFARLAAERAAAAAAGPLAQTAAGPTHPLHVQPREKDGWATYYKLLAWNMLEYDVVMTSDYDVHLSECPEQFIAAAHEARVPFACVHEESTDRGYTGLNTHMMLLRPNADIFSLLMSNAARGHYTPYTNTEQDVIESVFPAAVMAPVPATPANPLGLAFHRPYYAGRDAGYAALAHAPFGNTELNETVLLERGEAAALAEHSGSARGAYARDFPLHIHSKRWFNREWARAQAEAGGLERWRAGGERCPAAG